MAEPGDDIEALEGTLLSPGQMAALLGLSPRRIQQLAEAGVLPRSERGRYPLVSGVQSYAAHLQARAAGVVTGAGVEALDLHRERTRKTKFEADIAELKASQMRGDLIEVAVVEREASEVMLEVRARMLAIPDRLAPRILGETNERTLKAAATDEIEQALTALADRAVAEDEDDEEAAP